MTKSLGIHEMHGGYDTKAYGIWCGIRQRCNNPNSRAYKNYGGRGIAVCERWSKFSHFIADMGEPSAGMTIERIDNDKGYSKDNCIWATRTAQSRNRRGLFMIDIDHEVRPLSEWVEKFGVVNYATAHQRITKGWDAELAVKTPLVVRRRGVPRGERIANFDHIIVSTKDGPLPLWKAIELSGLKPGTVLQRMRRGWSAEAALSLSPHKGPRKEAAAFGANHGVVFQDETASAA